MRVEGGLIFLRVVVLRLGCDWFEESPGLFRSSKLRLLKVSQPLSTSTTGWRFGGMTFLATFEQDLEIWVNSLTPDGESGLTPCLVRTVGAQGLVPKGGGEGRML